MPVVAPRSLEREHFLENCLNNLTVWAWEISKAPCHVPLVIAVLQYEIGEGMGKKKSKILVSTC